MSEKQFACAGLTVGDLDTIIEQLGGAEGALRFMRGKKVTPFQIFATVKLGTGLRTADDFRMAINVGESGRYKELNPCGSEMLGDPSFTVSNTEMEIDLILASPNQLGFSVPTQYDKICERAIELGLDLCPAEVAPQALLQKLDLPNNCNFAMKPLLDSEGNECIFSLYWMNWDGIVTLGARRFMEAHPPSPECVLVFARRKSC